MKNIDHIGIAVKDINSSSKIYTDLLGYESYKTEFVTTENVLTEFFKLGESKIELLSSEQPDSAINKFIEKKGEGIHHIAILVDDIFEEQERLIEKGFTLINDQPKIGADNKLINFLHPKNTNGVLIELCQHII